MTANHTLRPVIDELRAADPMDAPPGAHVHFPEVVWPEPAPAHRPPSRADGRRPAVLPELPIGMIEPSDDQPPACVDPTAALAALADAEAIAHALVATVPRRPTLLSRIIPTTATAFWMAVSGWLGFLLARVEGWL